MLALAINVCWFLIGLVVLLGILWIAVWVLGQMGVIIPPMVMKVVMIVVGLLCVIFFLSLIAGGGAGFESMRLR